MDALSEWLALREAVILSKISYQICTDHRSRKRNGLRDGNDGHVLEATFSNHC